VPNTIFRSLAVLFRTGNCQRSRQSVFDLDEDPETLMLWIDENIPKAYRDIADVAAAYEALARADVYLGRVKRRQYYRMWAYASDMMSCGVSMARSRDYKGYVQYAFPSWLIKMSRSKSMRDARTRVGRSLGQHTRTSTRAALQEHLPYFRALYAQDREFRLSMTRRLRLSEEEVALLLGEKPDSHKVRHVFDALKKVEAVDQGSRTVRDGIENGEEPEAEEPEQSEPETQKSIFEFQG
jgi:replication factor C large subunit